MQQTKYHPKETPSGKGKNHETEKNAFSENMRGLPAVFMNVPSAAVFCQGGRSEGTRKKTSYRQIHNV